MRKSSLQKLCAKITGKLLVGGLSIGSFLTGASLDTSLYGQFGNSQFTPPQTNSVPSNDLNRGGVNNATINATSRFDNGFTTPTTRPTVGNTTPAISNQANIRQSGTMLFRAYTVDAQNVGPVADRLRTQLGNLIEVVTDGQKNRLLINCTAENHRLVEQVIANIANPSATTSQQTASRIKSIRSFNVTANVIREAANEVSQLYVDKDRIIVAADEIVGKLMVFATQQDYEEVATFLKRRGFLESSEKATQEKGEPGSKVQALKHIQWRDLEAVILKVWGNSARVESSNDGSMSRIKLPLHLGVQSTIQIDRRQNMVKVDSSGKQLEGIIKLLTVLDQDHGKDKVELIQTVPTAIDQIQSTVSMFKFASLQQDKQPQSTSAIVGKKAPKSGVYAIYQSPQEGEQTPATQDPQDDQTAGPIGRVEIITIPGTDIIILKGDPVDVERVRKLIEQIEKTSEDYQPQVEVLPLKHVDNLAVQVIVAEVYTNFYEPSLGQTSITALVKPNALLLVGPPEGVKQAKDIVSNLDVPVEPQTEFKVFRIKNMSAVDLENRLRGFYLGQQTGGFGANQGGAGQNTAQGFAGEGLAARLRIASDYRSNALFIHASPRDMVEITKFVNEIDVDSTPDGPEDEIKIVKLKNSIAADLAPIIQDVLTGQLQGAGQSSTGQGNNLNQFANQQNQNVSQIRAAMLTLRSLDPTGEVVKSGILFDTRITADENSNSLIIKAPKGSLELIELLIRQLDQLPDVESKIKVFELDNASALQVVETIQNLFETTQGGGNQGTGGTGNIPIETGGYESTIVSLRLAADARSNTVIAAGSKGDINIIEALIARLDEDIATNYIHRVYRLQNVTATDVAEAISGWLEGRNTILGEDPQVVGTGDGSLESVKRQITVQAETETNSLIVSAHKEYIHIIENIIEDIDFKKQVVIQAVIAEVQLGDTMEFGIEWGVQDSILFDRGLGTPVGFPFNQGGLGNTVAAGSLGLLSREDVAGQVLSNLSVGRTNADLGYGGLVVSAGNESINVLLRALDDKTKVDILSRPQITTMENIQAFIQVGQDVPYITGVDSDATAGGTTSFGSDFLELGVTLAVTPRIRPDGEIWMRVDVSNSSIADDAGIVVATTADGGVVTQPIINDQTLQTDITARSGQTVMLGGLIQKTQQDVVRGIPFFSNIPGIGRLFRFESTQNARSELIVILRPIVIDSPEDRDALMRVETERMNWCLSDIINLHGPIYEEEVLAGETDTVYPDRTPTGYHREANQQNDTSIQPVEMGSLAPLNGDSASTGRFNQMPLPNQQRFGAEYRQPSNAPSNVQPTGFEAKTETKKKPSKFFSNPFKKK